MAALTGENLALKRENEALLVRQKKIRCVYTYIGLGVLVWQYYILSYIIWQCGKPTGYIDYTV